MSFKQQSKVNLDIALYLNGKNMDKLGKINKRELASVIINRLYYGVFLMAKELVKVNGETPSREHSDVWRQIYQLLPKKPIDLVLWNSFLGSVDSLRTMRNIYDYEEYLNFGEDKIKRAIDKSFKYKQEIYDMLSQYI